MQIQQLRTCTSEIKQSEMAYNIIKVIKQIKGIETTIKEHGTIPKEQIDLKKKQNFQT